MSMFVYYRCIIMNYYFRSLTINRELQEIGANQAKFAQFAPKYPVPFNNTLCFRHLPRHRKLRNSSELRKFCAICPHSPRIMRNSHQLLTHYTLCFRHLPQQKTLEIPVDYADSTRFTHIVHESHEICTNCYPIIMFQMPDQWQRTP